MSQEAQVLAAQAQWPESDLLLQSISGSGASSPMSSDRHMYIAVGCVYVWARAHEHVFVYIQIKKLIWIKKLIKKYCPHVGTGGRSIDIQLGRLY